MHALNRYYKPDLRSNNEDFPFLLMHVLNRYYQPDLRSNDEDFLMLNEVYIWLWLILTLKNQLKSQSKAVFSMHRGKSTKLKFFKCCGLLVYGQ